MLHLSLQTWAFPYLTKLGKVFFSWIAEMEKDEAEPDDLSVLMMSHYIGRNITLVSGKGDEWKAEDIADDIILIYRRDHHFMPTDIGTCRFCFLFSFLSHSNVQIFTHISINSV